MTMSVKAKGGLALWGALFAVYFISTLFISELFGNILSPVCALTAAGVLIYAYIKTDRNISVRITYAVYALAFICWAAADTIWAVVSMAGRDPYELAIVNILYLLPNFLMLASITIFSVFLFSKWNMVQSLADGIIVAALTAFLAWIAFFHKDLSIFMAIDEGSIITILSIGTDILMAISIIVMFLSVRSGKIPGFIFIMTAGLFVYAVTDMLYFYQDYNNIYIPNGLVDFFYMCAIQLVAFGAAWRILRISSLSLIKIKNSGTRRSKRWHWLLLFPVFSVLFEGVHVADLLVMGILILLFKASGNYIQTSIENERLLEQEKNMNAILEERVKEQLSELRFLANQDTLTTLFNRRYFMTELTSLIETLRENENLTVFLIDLDRFKRINDNYGHDVGDAVLIETAQRLIAWNSCGSVLARLGGDEFAVIIVGRYSRRELEEYCMQIISECSRPIASDKDDFHLTISLGAAVYSPEAGDCVTLLKNADIAMYRAKSQGYNKFIFFDEFFNGDESKKIEIEKLLRRADFDREFELFYQPQFTLPDKALIGAEALLRWKNDQYGYIPPSEFIPIAEEIDYILGIGQWVMNETVCQSARWNKTYDLQLKLGFNVSPKQLNDEAFIQALKKHAENGVFSPGWIDAEITESIMMKEKKVQAVFELFDSFGISVSVDDFGTGYSSLSYLSNFPFDRIKIDKALIDKLSATNHSGIEVVRAIISMAKALHIITIAEGVETEEQLEILTKLGCDQVQGYLLGRPVPADIFEDMFISRDIPTAV